MRFQEYLSGSKIMIPDNNNKKILIVDDDNRILNILKDMLVPNGYSVILVRKGSEAINTALVEKPGLIMMDIMMPDIDGYTVCNILKQNEMTKQIPLVMISGIGYELNKKLSERLNADDYLVKPITIEVLLDIVHRYLDK
jgi:two-component system, OmpR family, alkaline phosphatase synthesis response regulator PhoP